MASAQCHKPDEKTSCHQKHSFGQKVSEMANSIFKGHGSQGQTPQCHTQTQTQGQGHHHQHHAMSKTSCQNHGTNLHTNGNNLAPNHGVVCQGKTPRRGNKANKRRDLLHKIKDGFSKDSDSGSSSSDSESDDEKCRKN